MIVGNRKTFIAVLGVLAGLAPHAVRAQEWLHLRPLEWSSFLQFEGNFQDRENSGGSRQLDLQEGIRFRQRGDILDPRLAVFSLEAGPIFSQGRSEGPGNTENVDALQLNYAGSLGLLQGPTFPVDFAANASRSTGDETGDLGSRTEFEDEIREGSARWKSRAFPIILAYQERRRQETFRSGLSGFTSERDDVLRKLSLSGHSSKTNVLVEREEFDDRVVTRNNDHQSNRANLSHRLRWGKNSSLLSRVNYFDRTGTNPSSRLTIGETVDIQHADNLSSKVTYRFDRFEQEAQTTEHTATYDLRHQLYQNLTTDFGLSADIQQSDLFQTNTYGTNLGFGYRKGIFWDGKLSLNASSGFRLTDRMSEGGFISVVDESSQVPADLIVLLNRRFIDRTSIVVTDANGQFVFTEGIDYLVRDAGGNFTEVRVVSGGPIAAGDTILVSYRFENLPSAEYYSIPYVFGARLDFGWISFFHNMSFRTEDLISGEDRSVLENREDWSSGFALKYDGERTDANFTAERRFLKIDQELQNFQTESYIFTQSLTQKLGPRLDLGASTTQSFSQSEDRNTNLYTLDVLLNWRPRRTLSIIPRAGAWMRQERGDVNQDERFVRVGTDVRWSWRKLLLDLQYEHNRRSGDVTEKDEDRIFVRLTRRF